ncbi:hypothetical protein KFL_015160020 [Klebsormidium nitens]|uniref:Uncharacterized protein n=1 Tax=Klebsormidium nitens TaxID=105231 RepID=A0A1Y1IR94_KLENI|nr:hypothetical protein KFL_015160020 [Klebsormidium nitens]|eukprot:GAQ93425.1 hypothetical protein KFL_015160020 [Klebsormidium nitens]
MSKHLTYIVCPDGKHKNKLQIIKECEKAEHSHHGLPVGYKIVADELNAGDIPSALQTQADEDVHYQETFHVRRIQQHTQVGDDGIVTFDVRDDMQTAKRQERAGPSAESGGHKNA